MKKYLVGGAVRDQFLGLTPKDRDYCVVGSTIEEMLSMGFILVGKRFPVFTHPETKEEYALARKEVKTGDNYKDFEPFFETSVSIEEDLKRRDLTINAIAYDEENNHYIDPYGGIEDLKHKVLKHVSSHFSEDAFRLVRLARFQSKLPEFKINPETFDLCKTLVLNGHESNLCDARMLKEFKSALKESKPSLFFQTLDKMGYFEKFFGKKLPINFDKALVHNDDEKTLAHLFFLFDFSESQYKKVLSYFKENKAIGIFYERLKGFKNVVAPDGIMDYLNVSKFTGLDTFDNYQFLDTVFNNKLSSFLKIVNDEYKNANIKSLNDKKAFFEKMIRLHY